jgi:lysophospholipase L1-like esterase
MLLTGAWDLLDRKIDGTWYSPGDVGFDRYFLSELDAATQLLASRGSKVVILTTPFFSRPELVGQTGHDWPEYQPWRVDRVNALYRDFLVAHPGRYTLLDLNRYVSPNGKFTDTLNGVLIRDDGVHFTPDGATYVSRWLAPQLETIAQQPATLPSSDLERFDPRHLRAT